MDMKSDNLWHFKPYATGDDVGNMLSSLLIDNTQTVSPIEVFNDAHFANMGHNIQPPAPAKEYEQQWAAPSLFEAVIPSSDSTVVYHRSGKGKYRHKCGDCCHEETLEKNGLGYVKPMAAYQRLVDHNRRALCSKELDRLFFPESQKHAHDPQDNYVCRVNMKINENGDEWIPIEYQCAGSIETTDGYRRHILQVHLNLGRTKSQSKMRETVVHRMAKMTGNTVEEVSLALAVEPSETSLGNTTEATRSRNGKRRKRSVIPDGNLSEKEFERRKVSHRSIPRLS